MNRQQILPILKGQKDHDASRPGKGRSYYKSALVLVDEVGYTPINREECNLFFRFIANRYEWATLDLHLTGLRRRIS